MNCERIDHTLFMRSIQVFFTKYLCTFVQQRIREEWEAQKKREEEEEAKRKAEEADRKEKDEERKKKQVTWQRLVRRDILFKCSCVLSNILLLLIANLREMLVGTMNLNTSSRYTSDSTSSDPCDGDPPSCIFWQNKFAFV